MPQRRPPKHGGLTMLGLDDEAMAALKSVILGASIAADDLILNEATRAEGMAAHDDIATVCELLGTTLEEMWAEAEAETSDPTVATLVGLFAGRRA